MTTSLCSRLPVSNRSRRIRAVAVFAVLALTFYSGVVAPAADARPPYRLGVYDNVNFVDPSVPVAQQGFWLDRASEAGVGVVRVDLVWHQALVDETTAPADPTNPADLNYDFSAYDAAVRAATERGMSVLFTIWGAPRFAEGPGRPTTECNQVDPLPDLRPPNCAPAGSWKPSASAFADFGTAVATRYSGSFTPLGDSSPLPQVEYLQAWNEPNLSVFLNPQRNPDGSNFSVGHYRAMLNGFYDAVHEASSGVSVLGPGASPLGPGQGVTLLDQRVSPQEFLRELACVSSSSTGLEVTCAAKPKFDIYAHNAIPSIRREVTDIPNFPDDDLQPANFEKGEKLLRDIESLGQVTPPVTDGRPIWATEFWVESDPPTQGSRDLRAQADSIQQGMRLLWKKGADVFLYFKLRDQLPFDSSLRPGGCLKQCGVGLYPNTVTWPFTVEDEPPKPALTAFSFPFTVERAGESKASVWLRPPLKGKVQVERLIRGKWTRIAKIRARKGVPITAKLSLEGKAKLRARVGSRTSLTWTLPAR